MMWASFCRARYRSKTSSKLERGGSSEAARHVCQYIRKHGKNRDVLAKIFGIYFVYCVGLGVMPIEIVLTGSGGAQGGNTLARNRLDIAAAASGIDSCGLNGGEELSDLLADLHRLIRFRGRRLRS